jgi:anti-anti-sigma regulatory factor
MPRTDDEHTTEHTTEHRPAAVASWQLVPLFSTTGLQISELRGEVDISARVPLESRLTARLAELGDEGAHFIVDVAAVTLLSSAGAGALIAFADHLAAVGRRLLLVTGSGPSERALLISHGADVLETFPTMDAALAALIGSRQPRPATSPAGDDHTELTRLRRQTRNLREKLLTRPLVARALGKLEERYGLADVDVADQLLRETSQRHNIKMRALAAAFLAATPPPSPDCPLWFPARARPAAPDLSFAPRLLADRTTFLDLVLDAAMSRMSAPAGTVQLVDPVRGGLTLERHHGLPTAFAEFFAHVGTDGSVCGKALRLNRTVEISDVATDPLLDDDARATILAAGMHTVRSTPLIAPSDECVGMVSTHHPEPGSLATAASLADVERIGAEAGAWLDWHTRLTTLDALEDLHGHAARAGKRTA